MRSLICLCNLVIFTLIFIPSAKVATIEIANDCKQISPAIVSDLKDFVDVLNKVEVDSIIAEHYLFDNDFRMAFDYVQTNDFNNLLNDLLTVSEVRDILDYLKILEPCSDTDLYVPHLEIVLLEAMWHEHMQKRYRRQRRSINLPATTTSTVLSSNSPQNYSSFTSFVEEVLRTVSHAKFSNLIKTKCEKGNGFKTFYTMLRSSSFRPKVEAASKSANLESFVKKLQSHKVDVKGLLPVFFELVSWGPQI